MWLRCCLAPLSLLVVCCSQDYFMPQCQNGTLQIRETQPQTPILCEGLTFYDNMNWMITDNNGTSHQVASCRDGLNIYKCSEYYADFSAWRNKRVSQLVIENYVRDKVINKTLTCVRRDRARKNSCTIRIVYPAEISRRSVTLICWTVTATAVINKVYDSDRNVVCLWNITGPNSIYVSEMERPQLSTFLESSRVYYSGSCSLSLPVTVTEGVYHVTVTVLPAGGPVAVGDVTLKKPGALLLLPACPEYIGEGSNLKCQCRHAVSLEGSPPARVTWLNHDDTLVLPTNDDVTPVLGTNDDDTSVLRVSSVSRDQNGTTYTCRSVWGPNDDLTVNRDYTLLVAYHPETPGDKGEVPLAFIVGGSVAAVVVVIVFIVVMVVIVVKRKNRTYERPRRRRGRPEHTYSDFHPDNNTKPQLLNTAPASPRKTAHNAADNTAFNTAHNTSPDTETGRVYVNIRSDGASGGAVYCNETSDTQTAPSTDGQDADHYYIEILPPVQ
ncbi:uncharacterized protein [Littorina saxatilis]|uniref:Ig-like domain-containing protein n=1 Tax=Littorina saxatilis TaxID=31220 RepID=A0AAN9BKM6_9CAEN